MNFPIRLEEVLFDLRDDATRSAEIVEAIRGLVNGSTDDLVQPNQVHEALVDLNPNTIITTNFDDLIERALLSDRKESQGYNVWAYSGRLLRKATQMEEEYPHWRDISLGDLLKSGIPLIAKIHGSLGHDNRDGVSAEDSLAGLVLSESDYRAAYDRSEVSPFLRSIFSTHQVLFIGYSLNDDEIRRVLSDLNTIRSSNVPHIFFQRDETVVSKKLVEYYRAHYGIAVVTLDDWEKLARTLRTMAVIRDGGVGSLLS
ncbi:hypothetical protein HMPREF3171_09090 [Corynebacterium sp. HMSC08F01]|nr:hypothetical protein HMPREF3171_09090 [Corynebacterium sp. HMSC08F01]